MNDGENLGLVTLDYFLECGFVASLRAADKRSFRSVFAGSPRTGSLFAVLLPNTGMRRVPVSSIHHRQTLYQELRFRHTGLSTC